MCTLQNHVEKVCTLVSLYHVYFKFVYSVMAPPFLQKVFLLSFHGSSLPTTTAILLIIDCIHSSEPFSSSFRFLPPKSPKQNEGVPH